MTDRQWVVIGGSGFIGTAVSASLAARGADVVIVDRHPPSKRLSHGVTWQQTDLLTDPIVLPEGRVVLTFGTSEPRPAWPWTLALDNAVTTARLIPTLAGREVVLVSSVEVYGAAASPLVETTTPILPWGQSEMDRWCVDVLARTISGPCPPWKVADLCRRLADADPSGRWVYGMSKWAQEQFVTAAATDRLTVLRVGNVFGVGQYRFVAQAARSSLAGRSCSVGERVVRSFVDVTDLVEAVTGDAPPGTYNVADDPVPLADVAELIRSVARSDAPILAVTESDAGSCGMVDSSKYRGQGGRFRNLAEALTDFVRRLDLDEGPLFEPPLPVVVPSKPARPDLIVERQSAALWSGTLKAGQRWTEALTEDVAERLGVAGVRSVLLTASGTAALRIVLAATVGPPRPSAVAALPSYTFPATAEALVQLGYNLLFVDVDPDTWTISAPHLDRMATERRIDVVVAVDIFGNPADYPELRAVCEAHRLVLIADSAAALGARVGGVPVGSQADAHAFSMSFAKTVSSGGVGGIAVLPPSASLPAASGWDRSEMMSELHGIVGVDQWAVLDELVRRRADLVATYRSLLAGHPDLRLQEDTPGTQPSFAHFVVRVTGRDREETAARLAKVGIGTKPYFPALHRTLYTSSTASTELPVTDALHREALALPLSSEMTVRDAKLVVVGLERALARSEPVIGLADVEVASSEPLPVGG